MANTIDQLNFDVILHDEKFNKTIDKILSKAGSLNTSLSSILDINSKFETKEIFSSASVTNAKEILSHLKDIKKEIGEFGDKSEKGEKNIEGLNKKLTQTQGLMQTLAQLTGVTFGLAGIRSFISSLTRVTGEFEVQKMALTSMLQDANKADQIFNTLRKNALESPYTFQDLTKYAKQLTAFNIDADKLVETEKRLADVSAGLGVDMGRIILAYGQVKAAGVLKGTELRQFTEAGVPLLQSLADQIKETEGKAISLSEVFARISKKQIPFEMVEEAFRRMTDEGGKFYNMQEVLVNTLQGKIGKLRDVWQQMLYDMGSSNDILKWSVDLLTKMAAHFDTIAKLIAPAVAAWGMYKIAIAAAASAQTVITGTKSIISIINLTKEIGLLAAVTKNAAIASKALAVGLGGITAVAVGVGLVINQIQKAREEQERYNRALDDTEKAVKSEIANLDMLKARLENAKKGTKEYNDVKNDIIKNYGKYYDGLDQEITKVGNLTTAYDKLKDSVEESIRVRGYSEFESNEKKIYEDSVSQGKEHVKNRLLKNKDLTRATVNNIMNEIDRAILRGDTYDDFSKTSLFEEYFPIGKYVGDIRQLFSTAKTSRDEYLKNTRQAIKDFGLKGTTLDPDFVGPLLPTSNDTTTTTTWGPNKNTTNEAKDNINTIIDSIKELQRAYKDFKTMGLDDETILKLFGDDKMFGYLPSNLRNRLDYWDMLLEQADEMEKYDPNDAKGIRAEVARGQADQAKKDWEDNQKAIKASYNELEKYGKAMDKWFAKDYSTSGQGFSNDVNKILTDYQTKQNEADLEASHRREELYASEAAVRDQYLKEHKDASEKEVEEYWKGYAKAGEAAILLLLGKQKEANRVAAQENINDLANKAVKDATKGMSLTDWGDKSIGQVYGLYKELSGLAKDNNIDLSAKDSSGRTLEQRIKSAGLSIKDFKNLTKEAFDKLSDEAKEELQKKVGALVKEVAQDFLSCADSVKSFAEASGNLELAATISDLEEVGSLISTIAQRAIQGDWIGAVTSAISFMVKQIFAAKTEIAELQARISEAAEESRALRLKDALSVGVDSIFGSDELQKAQNAIRTISDLRKSMDGYASDINSMRFNKRKYGFFESTRAAALGLGKFETQSIVEMAKAVGGDLYDAYGNLNADTLQAILDTYDKLDAEQRGWIERAIHDSETYAEAMEQIDDVAESILGDVVSDVADKMVDSWWEAGEAALDYADILGDVAKAYAKLIVQDMLMDAAFDENRQKEFKDALKNGDASKAMAVVEQAMASAESMLPAVNAALQAFEPYRISAQEAGDSSSNSSVGAGIKGITEDTANLLASYINAIRADVSYLRVMQEKGWQGVATIGEAIPTLNDYMNQIAANTYDSAQNTQSILSELQSVIGAPGTSGMVVRVESY